MAIRAPGYRPVNSRVNSFGKAKRNVVATLSLTAMVDMFTVLTIFLLQNYNPNMAEILDIPDQLTLPKAEMSRAISPSHVVNITLDSISMGRTQLASVQSVLLQEKWLIQPLFLQVREAIQRAQKERTENFRNQLQAAVYGNSKNKIELNENYRKVTVQADKGIDFAVIKKVMYTVTQAGGGEVSFAVLKK